MFINKILKKIMKNSEQKNKKIANFGLVALGHYFRVEPQGSITYTKNEKGEEQISANGSSDFFDPSLKMNENTVSGIGSITKQFTSAALLKLWDNEITSLNTNPNAKTWFADGIDTKLESFVPELRKNYPNCNELFDQIEKYEYYEKITLRDLLNHTHALGARNDEKAVALVINSNANPLKFSALVNITEKREGEKYGIHQYGNFGYDLTGMIIEIVARDTGIVDKEVPIDGEAFDTALHKLVLDPNKLTETYTQTDTKNSYEKDPSKFAIGYQGHKFFADKVKEQGKSPDGCQNAFNLISNTRAAGGLKSTVKDLAKFALLFMKGKMFDNVAVKETVLDRAKGAKIAEKQANKPDDNYHLAIFSRTMPNMIGHSGGELTYQSNLGLDEKTGDVKIELKVCENLIEAVTREVIQKLYPDDCKEMEQIKRNYSEFTNKFLFYRHQERLDGIPPSQEEDNKYFPFMEKLIEDIKKTEVPEGQIGIPALVEKYNQIQKEVLEIPRDKLSKNTDAMILEMVKNHSDKSSNLQPDQRKISIDALDLASPKPSPNPQKSYAEKMAGVSKGGNKEI